MIFRKKLVVKLIKILISLLILYVIFFFINQYVSHKLVMPYTYERLVK